MPGFFIPLLLLVIAGNVLWYWIKEILKKNGYPIRYFGNSFQDIPNIFRLAKKTIDKSAKRKYYTLGFSLISLLVLIPTLLFFLVPSIIRDSRKEQYDYFLNKSFHGIVLRTYKDSVNHYYKTIEIKTALGVETNTDLVGERSDLFEFLKANDTIEKSSGNLGVRIRRENMDTTFFADLGH